MVAKRLNKKGRVRLKTQPKLTNQTALPVFFIYFVLTMSTLLVFGQVWNFDFVNFDDAEYVYENQHVLGGLTGDGIAWAFREGHVANWHPFTWLSLMLDCQLFGPDPGRFHLVNAFLHLANVLLLFAVLKKMTGSLWPSAFVAAAFAIHPMHVESVAWIAERKDVLSTFFFILTLAAYAGYVNRPSVFRYTLSLMLFAFGLMSKPMLVTLPFVLLLLDYWPLNRFEIRWPAKRVKDQCKSTPAVDGHVTFNRLIVEKIPFLILSVISSIITFIAQRSGGATRNIDDFSLGSRIANALLSYVRYIGKMFWPEDPAVFYPVGNIAVGQSVLCLILLVGITLMVLAFGRSRKYLPVGWFLFIGTLVPVIGLVQVGLQAYADRYTYIPYIGLFIMIAWGLTEFLSSRPYHKAVLSASMVIAVTLMGGYSYRQVGFWRDSVTLFVHAIEVVPNNHIAYYSLARAYKDRGCYQEAIEAGRQAIRIKPSDADAHYNLGVAYISNGDYQEAIEACLQAIKYKPDDAEAYNNLGIAYASLGRGKEAIEAFGQAIRIKPDYVGARCNLGFVYLQVDDKTSAMEEYKILKTLDTEMADKLFDAMRK